MTALHQLIERQARRFDPVSLVHLLIHLGYAFDDLSFCSHYSICSQSSLVESVQFRHSPKKVIITLNLGLLGGQSLLPSYFFKQVHYDKIELNQFVSFFGYFDDRLLRRYLLAVYPELDYVISKRTWEERKRSALYSLKLDSPVFLHWLMRLVFPELQVRLEKVPLRRNIELGAPILGKSALGQQTVFGRKVELPVPGRRITLIADEEKFVNGEPWPHEIDRRLQQLAFPLLRTVGLDVEIWLVIRAQSAWLRLEQSSYLGYENMRGETLQNRRIRIFSGRLFDWH